MYLENVTDIFKLLLSITAFVVSDYNVGYNSDRPTYLPRPKQLTADQSTVGAQFTRRAPFSWDKANGQIVGDYITVDLPVLTRDSLSFHPVCAVCMQTISYL